MDKVDLIVKMIEDHGDRLESFREQLTTHQKTEERRLQNIEQDLKEHMRRTDILEKLHKDNESRIIILEEPRLVLKFARKTIIILGSIAGALFTLLKVMEHING